MSAPVIDAEIRKAAAAAMVHAHNNPISEADQERNATGGGDLSMLMAHALHIPPDYRAVYTLDEMRVHGFRYGRHLSLFRGRGKPSVRAMEEVMKLFGFEQSYHSYVHIELPGIPSLQIIEPLYTRPQ